MNSEMSLIIANTVKDFMEREMSFSNYDIFCAARKNNNWNFRYLSVRDDVRRIIKNAVDELGLNYTSSFNTNNNGEVYLLYHVAELEDTDLTDVPDDSDFEEDEDGEFGDTDDYVISARDNCARIYCDKSIQEFNVKLDSRGRAYITKEHVVESGLERFLTLFVSFFNDKNEVIISDKPIVDADSVKVIGNSPDRLGFHVSLRQYFGNAKTVTITSKHNKNEIVITL